MPSAFLIGIGGVSRSGKSTLAEKLLQCMENKQAAIINQDEYIHSGFQMPMIENELDWEDPDSLDFNRMYYEISWLSKNVEILIIEGLFAFYFPLINKEYHKKILVELDYETFHKRKQKDERWGKVPDWYIDHIWKSYHKYGLPYKMEQVLRVNGANPFDLKSIFNFLELKQSLPDFSE